MSRLGTLSVLYVTQYLGIGFITVGLTAILGFPFVAVAAAVLVLLGVLTGLRHQRQHRLPVRPAPVKVPAEV